MTSQERSTTTIFAIGMMGLGVLALVYGDFAMVWQPVAAWVPGRTALAYLSGALMLTAGAGLLFRGTVAWAVRILFPYSVVWMLLKIPAVAAAPAMEAVWLGLGELVVLMAGTWTLFARLANLPAGSRLTSATGKQSVRIARLLFAISLLPIGLSHLIYVKQTAAFVPAWLPWREGWAYLTGAGQIACGLGVLFSILPRLAATAEAGMISLFTILVWAPAILAEPGKRLAWTGFFISWAIAAAAWVVARNIAPNAASGTLKR